MKGHRRRRLHKNLGLLRSDAAAWAIMAGAGESYFVAFALASGLSQVEAALVATVPVVLGAALHAITPWGARWVGSLKWWVVGAAALQSASLAALATLDWLGGLNATAIYSLITLYWAAGFATAPPWQAWAPTLVPRRIATHFWARRNHIVLGGLCLGLLGGLLLAWGQERGLLMTAFAALLAIAAVARAASTVLLANHGEPQRDLARSVELPSLPMLKRDFSDRTTRALLLYMLAVVFSVNVSGAFFTPYMLDVLHFSYAEFLAAMIVTFAARVLALPGVGRLAARFGPGVPLWMGGIGIVPMATLWTVSDSVWWILTLQFVVGVTWACWETATFLLIFDVIPAHRRTGLLTVYNLAHASAMVVCSLVGAGMLRAVGVGRDGYTAVFIATGLMRLMTLFLLAGIEPRRFRLKQSLDLYLETLGIRFGGGTIELPHVAERRDGR